MAEPQEIDRIARAMNVLRPDWRVDSLVTFLTRNHASRPRRDLAIAALIVATDERTKTPALLNEHGAWWVAAYEASKAGTPRIGPGSEPRCDKDGHEHELARWCRWCRSESIAEPDDEETPR